MSIQCSPADCLVFSPPFTTQQETTFSFTNTDTIPVAFKIFVNDVKAVCARPNMGLIGVGETRQVCLRLNALEDEPAPGTKCKNRLKIRTTRAVGAGCPVDAAFWKGVRAEDTREHKIRFKYDWTDGVADRRTAVQRLEAQLEQAQAEIRRLSALVAASPAMPQQAPAQKIVDGYNASTFAECPPSYHECVDVEAHAAHDLEKRPFGLGGAQASASSGLFGWLFRMFSRTTGSRASA